jgi:hypothetical protein
VHVVQVDVLDAEPPQTPLQRGTQGRRAGADEDRLAPVRCLRTRREGVPRIGHHPGALRREEDVVATADPAQPAAEQLLTLTAVGARCVDHEYASAVSMKPPPSCAYASSVANDVASSARVPMPIAPSASALTSSPLLPSCVVLT